MNLKPNQTQVGPVIISRQNNNTYRCVAQDGSGIATVDTYAEAMKVARDHNAMSAFVRLVGKEEAIEAMRNGYKP